MPGRRARRGRPAERGLATPLASHNGMQHTQPARCGGAPLRDCAASLSSFSGRALSCECMLCCWHRLIAVCPTYTQARLRELGQAVAEVSLTGPSRDCSRGPELRGSVLTEHLYQRSEQLEALQDSGQPGGICYGAGRPRAGHRHRGRRGPGLEPKLYRVGPNCETWPNSLTENTC